MGESKNEAGNREHPSGPRDVHRVQGEGVREMLIGPLLFFLWIWTEKFMLYSFPTRPSAEAIICAGGRKRKRPQQFTLLAGEARDAISSQERERLALAVGAETTNGKTTSQVLAA
jgi:hypothetical protein